MGELVSADGLGAAKLGYGFEESMRFGAPAGSCKADAVAAKRVQWSLGAEAPVAPKRRTRPSISSGQAHM